MTEKKNFTVGICTLGCKVNHYESRAIAEAFLARGCTLLPAEDFCDIYIINTCTVTAEADHKGGQFIRRAIGKNPDAIVGVTGCRAQIDPQGVGGIAGVDFVCGNSNKMAVVNHALSLAECGRKSPQTLYDFSGIDSDFEKMTISAFDRIRAYIKIEDGCENQCAYCVIPRARGRIRSKPPREVLREVENLTRAGVKEIVLTGIETGSYGKDLGGFSFADLLCEIDRIPGVGRIRLGSLDPTVMTEEFVSRIAPLSSLCPQFHLSLQSGSSRILAAMRRRYNREMALEILKRVRKAIPGVQFTTDIITGFPGETEEDFAQTLAFAEEAKFLAIHAFPYSRRAQTEAAAMPGQIPENIKRERVAKLEERQRAIRTQILSDMAESGRVAQVLFEIDRKTKTCYLSSGHTPDFVEIRVKSDRALRGECHPVKFISCTQEHGVGILLTSNGKIQPFSEI